MKYVKNMLKKPSMRQDKENFMFHGPAHPKVTSQWYTRGPLGISLPYL